MAQRPIDHIKDDSGRISDDPSRISSGSSSRMSPNGVPEAKNEGKRKKFRPLDAVRKLFKRRPKLKEIDSARARSTSALYGHASADVEDEEGGFLSRLSLRKNKSRSEDSVLVESRSNQGGILRKLAYSVEGINRSLYSSNSGKSSSQNSINSTESQDVCKDNLHAPKTAVEYTDASVDFEAVGKTEALNTDAAKFKISVRPKGRKGSRQNRHHRQKAASNLPCLSEELNGVTNPSLIEDDPKKITQDVENEKPALKAEEEEIDFKQQAKLRTGSANQELPPKPRPKSTPVIIHSTPEIKERRLNAVSAPERHDGPRHLLSPEPPELGKVRSRSLDIDSRVQTSSDLGLSPVGEFDVRENVSKDEDRAISRERTGRKSPEINNADRRGFPPLDFRRTDLAAGTMKLSRSCEIDLDIGSRPRNRPQSSDVGDKNARTAKSLELGLRFKQNPEDDDNVPTPIRSPVRKIDFGILQAKSPRQTPTPEQKPFSSTTSLNLDLKSISPTDDGTKLTKKLTTFDKTDDKKKPIQLPTSDYETTDQKSPRKILELNNPSTKPFPKPFESGFKPVKSPVYASESSALSGPNPLKSPVRQTQDVELTSRKTCPENDETEDQTTRAFGLPASGHVREQVKSLHERRREISEQSDIQKNPTTTDKADHKKTNLSASDNETAEPTKSPRKIIANLELNNLSAKPFRSFSDPKSPRSTLRSSNLSPKSPVSRPRSPALLPKPARSPTENLDTNPTPSDSDGSKRDAISNSSESLLSKSPPSPSVPVKPFLTVQKTVARSCLTSPKSEAVGDDVFFKATNSEQRSVVSPTTATELPPKPLRALKTADDESTVKKPSEKPNLRPKPLKGCLEISSKDTGSKSASVKAERSYDKPNDGRVDVEQGSQVVKNREIFQALGSKEHRDPLTPKKAVGVTKMSAFKSTPEVVAKGDVSASSTEDKSKTAGFLRANGSSLKAGHAVKTDIVAEPNGKRRAMFGSCKAVPASAKDSSPSRGSVSAETETEKESAGESSDPSSQKAEPVLGVTPTGVCKPSDPSSRKSEPVPSVPPTGVRKPSDATRAAVAPPKPPALSSMSSETPDGAESVATTSKDATDPKKPAKPSEVTAASAAAGIDVSTNNTNRLSALFEARSVEAPGTTVKIEVVARDAYEEQPPVTLREKTKSSEKISELSSRQSKVLDMVKNFQKLQAT